MLCMLIYVMKNSYAECLTRFQYLSNKTCTSILPVIMQLLIVELISKIVLYSSWTYHVCIALASSQNHEGGTGAVGVITGQDE